MTDEKVKEAVERLTEFAEAVDWQPTDTCTINGRTISCEDLRAILAHCDALQAERDKLAAENDALDAALERSNKELFADKVKLTALVEALPRALDAYRDAVAARRFHNGTKNERHWAALLEAEKMARENILALAHHSAPVGEAKPVKMLVDADWLRERVAADPDCDGEATPPRAPLIERLDAAILSLNPLTGFGEDAVWRPADRARKALIEARDILSAPPSTPTSAPVEDVGGLVERWRGHAQSWRAHMLGAERSDGLRHKALADAFAACADDLAALIQPQGGERRCVEVEKALSQLARAARRVLDAREAWRSPDRGSHPNLVREEAEAWIELGACFDANTRSTPPQEERSDPLGLAAADDNHKVLVEAVKAVVEHTQIQWAIDRANMKPGSPLCHAVPVFKLDALKAAFQSRKEESR